MSKDQTKALKNDQAKPDLSLIPYEALVALAQAFMVGEKKYGRSNYYKGHKASQLVAAAMRHLSQWMEGEENDPIDGQPHLGSVMACASMLLKQQALGTLKDNRYGKADSDEGQTPLSLVLETPDSSNISGLTLETVASWANLNPLLEGDDQCKIRT